MDALRWSDGTVSAVRHGSRSGTVLALTHGAGGDLDDPILAGLGGALAEHLAVVRFNLPYREAGRRSPGSPASAEACWRDVIDALSSDHDRVLAGGKSYGGRMASQVAAAGAPCHGLVLLSYPLHPPGKPERLRDAHLPSIGVPMLFVQGTRDTFAADGLLRTTVDRLPGATLHTIEGGDHSLRVKGRAAVDVVAEIAGTIRAWVDA